MKSKYSVTVLLALIFTAAIAYEGKAQLINVPQVVKESFDKKYPAAKEVDWTNNIGSPEVKFKFNDESSHAKFSQKGDWQWTQVAISEDKLPAEVKDGFSKSKFADWSIKQVARIERPEKSEYQLTISKGSLNSKNLLFSSQGRLLKQNYTL